jgi:hypothetical protein
MTATNNGPAATDQGSRAAASTGGPASPAAFVRELERIFATEGAAAASRYFGQSGAAMMPRLSGKLETRVEEIMHVVDTIAGWMPPPGARSVMIVSDDADVGDDEDEAHPLTPAPTASAST